MTLREQDQVNPGRSGPGQPVPFAVCRGACWEHRGPAATAGCPGSPARPAHGTAGTGNSPDPCRAVPKAGLLPKRGHTGLTSVTLSRQPAKDEQRLLLAARVDVALEAL
jgi:hypothetical protein